MSIAIIQGGAGSIEILAPGSDHGSLSGLEDDDHSQYVLVDGSRAMSGNLNMGSNAITNATSVSGTSFVVTGQYTLPIVSGSSGYYIQSDGDGTTSWVQNPWTDQGNGWISTTAGEYVCSSCAQFTNLSTGAYTFPSGDGTGGYFMCTNGSGTLGWAAAGGSSLWYDGTGYICPNNMCPICAEGFNTTGTFCGCYACIDCIGYYSQGYICVVSCLIDCNGQEILGGGSSLWYDGGGYICPCNYCGICVACGGSDGDWYVSGTLCTDYLNYNSQGCICVCACLIDCNGSEILGGGSSLWYDGGGYICPSSFGCVVCADYFSATYCYCAGGFAGVSTSWTNAQGQTVTVCGGIIVSVA